MTQTHATVLGHMLSRIGGYTDETGSRSLLPYLSGYAGVIREKREEQLEANMAIVSVLAAYGKVIAGEAETISDGIRLLIDEDIAAIEDRVSK